jgi:hypothetical protein
MSTKVNGYAARNGTNHSREHTVLHIDYSALTDQVATGLGQDILAIDCYRITRFEFNMYKYIQQDASILSWILFKEIYMFRAFTMPIIRSTRTLLHRQSLV